MKKQLFFRFFVASLCVPAWLASVTFTISLSDLARVEIVVAKSAIDELAMLGVLGLPKAIVARYSIANDDFGKNMVWQAVRDESSVLHTAHTVFQMPSGYPGMPWMASNPTQIVVAPDFLEAFVGVGNQVFVRVCQRQYTYHQAFKKLVFAEKATLFQGLVDCDASIVVTAAGVIAADGLGTVPADLREKYMQVDGSAVEL